MVSATRMTPFVLAFRRCTNLLTYIGRHALTPSSSLTPVPNLTLSTLTPPKSPHRMCGLRIRHRGGQERVPMSASLVLGEKADQGI
eukprot:1369070-Pleurochrysis_carterae.AAC.1